MRKVLSFVLVLSLVLGSFGMAFAAPLSDVAGEKCEDAVNVLTKLGVVSGYPDGTYKPDHSCNQSRDGSHRSQSPGPCRLCNGHSQLL
ncbi:MAG: S-layer homology domain-containing protein [Anaerovoracaceae bacterium]